MPPGPSRMQSRSATLFLALAAAALVFLLIRFPDTAFQASLGGLTLWWRYVFPALLPFLIMSELLSGLGAVRAFGIVLDPLMRALFRVPGGGGWALAVGLAGGPPAGAAAAVRLAREGGWMREEAERAVALAHLCSPVTAVTVVGAGFLHSARLGLFLAAVHYAAAFAAGLAMRLHGRGSAHPPRGSAPAADRRQAAGQAGLLRRSLRGMRRARAEDGRAFGKLLGDAVASSVQTLMALGGCIILFAVLARFLAMLLPEGADRVAAALPGLFEPHLGAHAAAQGGLPPVWTAALASAALAWSGLSQHAMVRAALHGSGIRYAPFATARAAHAAAAFLLTLALWRPLASWIGAPLSLAAPSGAFADGRAAGAGLIELLAALPGRLWSAFVSVLSAPGSLWSAFSATLPMLGLLLAGMALLSAAWFRISRRSGGGRNRF